MKKYFPEYFLDESGCIATGKIVVVRNNGIIDDIVEANSDMDDVVSLRGLMLPGLTNSHCHLELSWIQGLLPEGLGIERFYDAMQGVHQQKPENTESIGILLMNSLHLE
jgi:cytosine/adenosine deaminase-related metal-dependent hydrolase